MFLRSLPHILLIAALLPLSGKAQDDPGDAHVTYLKDRVFSIVPQLKALCAYVVEGDPSDICLNWVGMFLREDAYSNVFKESPLRAMSLEPGVLNPLAEKELLEATRVAQLPILMVSTEASYLMSAYRGAGLDQEMETENQARDARKKLWESFDVGQKVLLGQAYAIHLFLAHPVRLRSFPEAEEILFKFDRVNPWNEAEKEIEARTPLANLFLESEKHEDPDQGTARESMKSIFDEAKTTMFEKGSLFVTLQELRTYRVLEPTQPVLTNYLCARLEAHPNLQRLRDAIAKWVPQGGPALCGAIYPRFYVDYIEKLWQFVLREKKVLAIAIGKS